MGPLVKKLLNDSPYCALTRPLAVTAIGGTAGGFFAGICGAMLGVLEASSRLPLDTALRGALAGGVAGLLIGLWSVVDRGTTCRR
jgi:hypothetical protein